jgi:hypothetical protein
MNNQFNSPAGVQMQSPVPNPYFTNYAPVSAQTPFYSQPILQPAGMVYLINSPQELSTIPTQAGLNLYWCGNENKVYVRNFTGGAIEQKEYNLSMGAREKEDAGKDNLTELIKSLDTRISSLEAQLNTPKGGNLEWQL